MIRSTFAALAAALMLGACGDDAGPAAPYTTVPITPFMGETAIAPFASGSSFM